MNTDYKKKFKLKQNYNRRTETIERKLRNVARTLITLNSEIENVNYLFCKLLEI